MTKLCSQIIVFNSKNTFLTTKWYSYKIGKFLLVFKKIHLGFSSKIEVPQLGLARAGKFQLEPITTDYDTIQ